MAENGGKSAASMARSGWERRHVLITGVAGTVGKELLRQVSALDVAEVVGLDNNESDLFFLSQQYRHDPRVRLSFGDVRDRDTLRRKLEGIDVTLHAAALKHVILCEESPGDAIHTNILGTQNLVDAALANGVERIIFTSTDKAVNPTSVMGTSKLMGERLMTAANALRRSTEPLFASTRFGNVLGSRGSVIPLFRRQIANGGPVTLTHPDMTRFIMTLKEAVRLVLDSVFMAKGGEVFVTKMPVARIADLASVMVQELAPHYGYDPADVRIEVIGTKSGEKMYEELMNEEEIRRTVELERYFVVKPALRAVFAEATYEYPGMLESMVERPYNSASMPAMGRDALRAYLREQELFAPVIQEEQPVTVN